MDNGKENQVIHSSFWANFFNSPAEKEDLQKSLGQLPIFKNLSKKDVSLLANVTHNRNYIAGEYIFHQGDPGIGFYLIRDGEVIIQRENSETKDLITLATFGKGDFFGELALVDGDTRSASAIAKTEARLAVIFKPDLDEFVQRYPKKGVKILQSISKIVTLRLRKLNEDHLKLHHEMKIKAESDHGT
jgi:CRP/FNR family transcriptional regulator, cyclic AMP receptor protein